MTGILEVVVRIPADQFAAWLKTMQFLDLTEARMVETFLHYQPVPKTEQYVKLCFGRHI